MTEPIRIDDAGFAVFAFENNQDLRLDVFQTVELLDELLEPLRDEEGRLEGLQWCNAVREWLQSQHGIEGISWQAAASFANTLWAENKRLINFTRQIAASPTTTESTPEV